MSDDDACQATSAEELEHQIVDPSVPKNEREWWAYREIASLRDEVQILKSAAEMLWVVLANVSDGDWTRQSDEWQTAAMRWRNNYFRAIGLRTKDTSTESESPRSTQECIVDDMAACPVHGIVHACDGAS